MKGANLKKGDSIKFYNGYLAEFEAKFNEQYFCRVERIDHFSFTDAKLIKESSFPSDFRNKINTPTILNSHLLN